MTTPKEVESESVWDKVQQELPAKRLKIHKEGQQYSLPIEIIVNIISQLKSFEDLKNCMCLCSEIRDYIFKTPQFMKRMRIHFNERKEDNRVFDQTSFGYLLDFLKTKGKCIINLKVGVTKVNEKFFNHILYEASNVEEFEFGEIYKSTKSFKFEDQLPKTAESLKISPKLRYLRIPFDNLKFVYENVKNLKRFSIVDLQGDAEQTKLLTDFMNKQENLEELEIDLVGDFAGYHTINLSQNKFELKKLTIHREAQNLKQFLDTQADFLEELVFYCNPDPVMFNAILNFKKLKKMRLPMYSDDDFFYLDEYLNWELNSLEVFDCVLDMKVSEAVKRFPNLQTLICRQIEKDSGVFRSITTLDCVWFDSKDLRNLILPNLKTLIIRSGIEPCEETDWQIFAKNIENVKNLQIRTYRDGKLIDNSFVLKNLGIFKNLRHFFYGQPNFNGSNKKIEENEKIPKNEKFFKVVADADEKIVRISSYIVRFQRDILASLVENFKGFKFFEFCMEKIKSREIDTSVATTQLRKRTRAIEYFTTNKKKKTN